MYRIDKKITDEAAYDVAVIGGGTAGTFAAICAARLGASTVIIEKTSTLGGTITNAMVNFPGLFHAWGKQIIGGPCFEAIRETCKLGGAKLPTIVHSPKNHWDEQILVDPFIYTHVVEKMCLEAGVDILYHTCVADCENKDAGMAVLIAGKEGLRVIHAKRVIDCTGDANVVQMLHLETEKSVSLQPATLINNIGGYRIEDIREEEVDKAYRGAIQSGEIKASDFQGSSPINSLRGHRVHMHIPCADVSSSAERTRLEITAREALFKIIRFLRTIKGAEGLYVTAFATECGVRETARIVGETRMTVENYVSGYKYADALCYCFYPVDRHIDNGIKQIFLRDGVVPTIPLGALLPRNAENIMVAGRCASGDADSNSAYRVQAPCMAMGQIAGVASALSVQKSCQVRELVLDEIKEHLVALGAIVP